MGSRGEILKFPSISIAFVGNIGVGKGSLKWSYLDGRFPEYVPKVYHLDRDVKRIAGGFFILDYFEIPGDEEYDRLRPICYPKPDGNIVVVMCFAMNDVVSFNRLKSKLIDEVRQFYGYEIPMVLLGTKSDLTATVDAEHPQRDSHVSTSMSQQLATEMDISKFLRCSALNGDGVAEVFEEAVRTFVLRNISVRPSDKTCCHVI